MSTILTTALRLLKKPFELILAPDGSISASKISYLVFVYVFTSKMVTTMPEDPVLWFIYGGLVGGVEVAKKYISSRYLGSPARSDERGASSLELVERELLERARQRP